MAQLAALTDAVWPRDDEWVADAATVRVLLVAAERCVRGHRPAMRKVIVRLRPTDILEPRHLLRPELGPHVARAQRDASKQSALLAGAVVGEDEDDGIVALSGAFEEIDEARELPIRVIEHAGKCRLETGEEAALV